MLCDTVLTKAVNLVQLPPRRSINEPSQIDIRRRWLELCFYVKPIVISVWNGLIQATSTCNRPFISKTFIMHFYSKCSLCLARKPHLDYTRERLISSILIHFPWNFSNNIVGPCLKPSDCRLDNETCTLVIKGFLRSPQCTYFQQNHLVAAVPSELSHVLVYPLLFAICG